ncbi:DUF4230 domain-containing protein [Urechidicola croceus]|uniref:DUF4230 domain-containing protein n=1 Tax=Urechidicola croceus TaxID=1850246 RepID=A0A1D8P7H8_9FLAO|nr:DUF4230 domain-containing protein [Urechidicola croceus]AOW20502.1 hypothetical protein LPB138_07360 [Urechidicola croceus]
MDVVLGVFLGMLLSFFGVSIFNRKSGKEIAEKQSVVLLEKIKNVCKLVTVEGEFSEIYHYENTKERFMSLFSSKKKAILLVKAKTQIGYDLKKILLNANPKTKTVFINDFPQAEILTIDADVQYYDKSEGLFNKFAAEDLTALNKEVKQFIKDKIPESGLLETANQELIETIGIIQNIVETIGWKLDTKSLELPVEKKKILE